MDEISSLIWGTIKCPAVKCKRCSQRSQIKKGLARAHRILILLEVSEGAGDWIFTLDVAVWRTDFRETLLETGAREDKDSNQERNSGNGGEAMWSTNTDRVKSTEHHGDGVECEGEHAIKDHSQGFLAWCLGVG